LQNWPAAGGEPAAGFLSIDPRPALPVPVAKECSMPIAESNPAATLTFDAAVSRALARRHADTPLPPRPETVAEAEAEAAALLRAAAMPPATRQAEPAEAAE